MWQWWLIFYDLPSILWATLVSDSAVCAIQCRSGIFATIFLQQGIGWSDSQKQASSTAFVEVSERAKNMNCHRCNRLTSGKCIIPIHLGSFRESILLRTSFPDPSKGMWFRSWPRYDRPDYPQLNFWQLPYRCGDLLAPVYVIFHFSAASAYHDHRSQWGISFSPAHPADFVWNEYYQGAQASRVFMWMVQRVCKDEQNSPYIQWVMWCIVIYYIYMVQRRPAPPMGMSVQFCFFMVPPPVACGGGVFGMLVMGGQSCFLWFPPPPMWPVVVGCLGCWWWVASLASYGSPPPMWPVVVGCLGCWWWVASLASYGSPLPPVACCRDVGDGWPVLVRMVSCMYVVYVGM